MKNYFTFTLLLTSLISCESVSPIDARLCEVDHSQVVQFNEQEDYPMLDLKLSDVADVQYIPLSGAKDNVFVKGFANYTSGRVVATPTRIYMLDWDTSILGYDYDGNLLLNINRVGRGPQEYIYINSFVVDELRDEIMVYDGSMEQVMIYDCSGVFKRKLSLDFFYSNISQLGDSALLCYNFVQSVPGEPTMSVFNKFDGSKTDDLLLNYTRPYVHDFDGRMNYPSIIDGIGGKFIVSLRSDTIYFMDDRRNISARFVDDTPRSTEDVMICPVVETSKYVFFSTLDFEHRTPDVKPKYYAYDKTDSKFYQLEGSSDWDYPMTNGFINPTHYTLTQSPNMAAQLLQPAILLENEDRLSPELKMITSKLTENDNPVLMIVTFK